MRAAGDALRAAGVGAIYLVHGTFAGNDTLGLLTELGCVLPAVARALKRLNKATTDAVLGEHGNYTAAYARLFEDSLCHGGAPRIAVRRFHWSGENNHLGRADAAVKLLTELRALDLPAGQRVVLWGHSHAGNVFAMLTHLMAGDDEARNAFFQAAEIYFRRSLCRGDALDHWKLARKVLEGNAAPLGERHLDLVTFGTPIRHGWNDRGYGRLLHFVHHRPAAGEPAYRAPFPESVADVLDATHGDYIQQAGIAGSNLVPLLFAWRAFVADRRLHKLLHASLDDEGLLTRLRRGVRVADSGTTLLVDYGRPPGAVIPHMAGHAVYTQREWLLFHVEAMVRQWRLGD